ncbi:hypothetical protein OQA88_7367 [Cercophora sp. LCS_1]
MGPTIVFPGEPSRGVYYVTLGNLPYRTEWWEIKSLIRRRLDRPVDMYVWICQAKPDHGWVRVLGRRDYEEVRRVLGEKPFRGHYYLLEGAWGYEGRNPIEVHEPLSLDAGLFFRRLPQPLPWPQWPHHFTGGAPQTGGSGPATQEDPPVTMSTPGMGYFYQRSPARYRPQPEVDRQLMLPLDDPNRGCLSTRLPDKRLNLVMACLSNPGTIQRFEGFENHAVLTFFTSEQAEQAAQDIAIVDAFRVCPMRGHQRDYRGEGDNEESDDEACLRCCPPAPRALAAPAAPAESTAPAASAAPAAPTASAASTASTAPAVPAAPTDTPRNAISLTRPSIAELHIIARAISSYLDQIERACAEISAARGPTTPPNTPAGGNQIDERTSALDATSGTSQPPACLYYVTVSSVAGSWAGVGNAPSSSRPPMASPETQQSNAGTQAGVEQASSSSRPPMASPETQQSDAGTQAEVPSSPVYGPSVSSPTPSE